MNKIQATSLFVAVLSFLAIIPMFFFAATEHKNALFSSVPLFFLPLAALFGAIVL